VVTELLAVPVGRVRELVERLFGVVSQSGGGPVAQSRRGRGGVVADHTDGVTGIVDPRGRAAPQLGDVLGYGRPGAVQQEADLVLGGGKQRGLRDWGSSQ
jgi:hypothetical protein